MKHTFESILTTEFEMLPIPVGTFQMGSSDSGRNAYDNEKSQHKVVLTHPFEMGAVPVTQELYQTVTGKNPSHFKGENLPVERVSWNEAVSFCNMLSKICDLPNAYSGEGMECDFNSTGFRLPTEAEWEYACRAGTTEPRYGELDDIAWYSENSGNATHPVGQKTPNTWGLYDMLGNVWEWCWDWCDDYSKGDVSDPLGPGTGSDRVFRGGSWYLSAVYARAALRNCGDPGYRNFSLGFRLARSSLIPLSQTTEGTNE